MEMGPFKHTVDDGLDIRKVTTMLGFTQSLVNGLPMIDSDSRLNYSPPPSPLPLPFPPPTQLLVYVLPIIDCKTIINDPLPSPLRHRCLYFLQ